MTPLGEIKNCVFEIIKELGLNGGCYTGLGMVGRLESDRGIWLWCGRRVVLTSLLVWDALS